MKKIRMVLAGIAVVAAAVALVSCGGGSGSGGRSGSASEWSDAGRWYQPEHGYDAEKVDVLYLVSTEVLNATDENGEVCWQSQLAEGDLDAIRGEIAWVEQNMFFGDFNVVAPLYHQLTFDALTQLEGADLEAVYRNVAEEVCAAFDYYMENRNAGRPFIIAGFSQGAMLTLDLLEHMTDEQYSNMVACYTLGYRLSKENLQNPHIKAAAGEGDTGVVISFNSTQTREAIWPLVSEDAAVCINPVNWKTDSTPATFDFNGIANTVHIDPKTNVLLVDTDDPEYYYSFYELALFFLNAGVSKDNLHHWDLLFYASQIHDNALLRARFVKF